MASSPSYAQQFLSYLKPAEVEDFFKAMENRDYSDFVNPLHVSASLNLDQLKTMKSIRPQNGAFLFEWMTCKVQKHRLNRPGHYHDVVTLYLNGTKWPRSVQRRFNEFCVSESIDKLNIHAHHIALRCKLKEKQLPLLTCGKNQLQGSHLCDTLGCILKEHLCIETQEVNSDRRRCQGITVHIYDNTTDEFIILQIDPCRHGEQHKEANGDFLKYSCRKIRAIFLTKEDLC